MPRPERPKYGVPMAPNFFFPFTTAEGATLPEGEGNPAEGGSSRVGITLPVHQNVTLFSIVYYKLKSIYFNVIKFPISDLLT